MSPAKTLSEARAVLSRGGSVLAATEASFASAEANKDLNAFLEVFTTSALEQAVRVDAKRAGMMTATLGIGRFYGEAPAWTIFLLPRTRA